MEIARRVYSLEKNAPRWFVESQSVWVTGEDEFIEFWKNCAEIFGLFENDELKTLLYIEHKTPEIIEVHVSSVGKTDTNNIVRFFRSLARLKRSEGVKVIRGWILSKNRPMIAVAQMAGFYKTGLRMSFGQAKGKVLRWVEVQD